MTRFERLCREHGALASDIRGPSRKAVLVAKRRAIARAMHEAGLSLPQIGLSMHRHHSTIINLLRPKSERRAQND